MIKVAAFYIPKGRLAYIFGEGHDEITLNFGGSNLYKFVSGELEQITSNKVFVDDLFSDRISLLSCLVGSNGSGKTTLLNEISNGYHFKYVLEDDNGSFEVVDNLEHIHRIYYTPYLNYRIPDSVRNNAKDLSKLTMIELDNHGDSGLLTEFLEAHHSETIKRWIEFNDFYSMQEVSSITLPTFSYVDIKLQHFEHNVDKPDKFHNTSYQLRPAITHLFEKLKQEQEAKEGTAGQGRELTHEEAISISNLIRFEYDMYETGLGKFVTILERAGNRYLDKGYINGDYEEMFGQMGFRQSLQWFLEHAGVFSGDEKYSFQEHLMLFELFDFILSLVNNETMTDNWRIIRVTNAEALVIMKLYNKFNLSFVSDWLGYVAKPMFSFSPDMIISSGEQAFLNLFSLLYNHAENIRTGIDIDRYSFDTISKINEDILLLIDEGDSGFHPQWKKEYVMYLREITPIIFKGFNIQIIITSHDPLTLSDFAKNNVVFLQKADNITVIGSSVDKRTFGANIADLLRDTFFMNDGQIGSFAAKVIDNIIEEISDENLTVENANNIQRQIQCIDEPIIRFKLAEMLSDSLGNREFEIKLIDEEIEHLKNRKDRI